MVRSRIAPYQGRTGLEQQRRPGRLQKLFSSRTRLVGQASELVMAAPGRDLPRDRRKVDREKGSGVEDITGRLREVPRGVRQLRSAVGRAGLERTIPAGGRCQG